MIRIMVNTPRSSGVIRLVVMVSMKPMMCAAIRLPTMEPMPPTITTATAMIKGATHMSGVSWV